MKRLAILIFLSSISCWGQSSCKVYFKIVEADPHIIGGYADMLTAPQRKWLDGKERKQYPGVCYAPQNASYAIVWTQERHAEIESQPESSAVTDTSGNEIGHVNTSSTETVTRFVTYVSVMRIGDDGKLIAPPLYFDTDHYGLKDRFRPALVAASSSQRSLEQAIKFLSSMRR